METKLLEVRDQENRIPVLAMEIGPSDAAADMLRRCGLSPSGVVVVNLMDQTAHKDFKGWRDSVTMATAHAYIDGRFDQLADGDIVDVQFILSETPSAEKRASA